jgi:hypothetical protein
MTVKALARTLSRHCNLALALQDAIDYRKTENVMMMMMISLSVCRNV